MHLGNLLLKASVSSLSFDKEAEPCFFAATEFVSSKFELVKPGIFISFKLLLLGENSKLVGGTKREERRRNFGSTSTGFLFAADIKFLGGERGRKEDLLDFLDVAAIKPGGKSIPVFLRFVLV